MPKGFVHLIVLSALFASVKVCAQGQVTINKPDGLDGLIASRTAHKKNPDARITGYHILIYFGSDKSKADAYRQRFDSEFGGRYPSTVAWEEPNFKLYVGQFKTKMECLTLYNEIKTKYQTCIVIKDKIPYPKI